MGSTNFLVVFDSVFSVFWSSFAKCLFSSSIEPLMLSLLFSVDGARYWVEVECRECIDFLLGCLDGPKS